MRYAKVTAAEAYARAGEDRPRCECHDEPMKWSANPRRPAGGGWFCVVKARSANVAATRAWRVANPEQVRAQSRAWHAAHPEAARAASVAWRRANPEMNRAANLAATVAQLERGEWIANYANHHKAMATLKAQRGEPRPDGMTLSLVEPLSPTAYLGYALGRRGRALYVLDVDPDNYEWETMAQNNARGFPVADPEVVAELVRRGVVTPQAAAILEERAVA